MTEPSAGGRLGDQPAAGVVVVVPHQPGPLVPLDADDRRGRDELDELIDDLFPEVDERPGLFDAGLAAGGIALLGWAWLGDPPGFVPVLGAVVLGLACILPVRAAWRRVQHRSRRRRTAARLAAGQVLDTSTPPVASLVTAYRELFDATSATTDAELLGQARAAAHAALMEVASLLHGRSPASDREVGYVDQRATAVADLVASLRALPDATSRPGAGSEGTGHVDPDLLVAAREELDRLAPFTAVQRVEQVTAEARQRHRR